MPLLGGLLWLTILGLSRAQHDVTIEQGPLYRTAGSHITIWCRVTGYQGLSNRKFDFITKLQSDPEKSINMVSSDDPNFSYVLYSARVQSRNIYVERVSSDHAILHIVRLEEKDTGEYECYTPNTATVYSGTYSATTHLKVIPNTLKVSMPQQAMVTSEGDSLELTCQVSMASSQHTHLSVSWILSTDRDTEILTLSLDFVLLPGGNFVERFMDGDVRLDKLSPTSYRLTIRTLRQSDQGKIFCRGSEWIQDPSGVWTKIVEKDSEKTNVKVAAVLGGDFQVQVKASATALAPGQPLEVTCSVTNTVPINEQFRVVWLLNGVMMAVWEPTGMVTFREVSSLGAEGRLVVQRRDLTSWVLRINHVRTEDGGSYVCEVSNKQSKKSLMTLVEVKRPEFRAPQLSLTTATSRLYEGDPLVFRCLLTASSSSSASLGWFRKAPSSEWMQIVSMLPDGQLVIGADYRRRHDEAHLWAEKANSGLFTLRLDDLTQSDGGEYVCRYSERTQDDRGDWRNFTTDSNAVHIDIQRLDSALQISLMTRNLIPSVGSTALLYCNAKADFNLRGRRLVWSWYFKPDTAQQGPFQSLVQGSGNGDLKWGDSYPDFKGKTQISLTNVTSILSIHQVQRAQQSGFYHCSVAILSTQSVVTTATNSSNVVTIKVQLPGMKLKLDSTSSMLPLTAGQDEAVVTCRILKRTPGTKLSIVWFFRPPSAASPGEIVRVDREGVTNQDPSLRPRFIIGRSSADSFFLQILRPGLGEVGAYHCAGQEWLLEGTDNWTQLGERKSGDTQITFTASDQTLKLSKQDVSSSVKQGEVLLLHCPLEAVPSPTSLLSISWYQQGWDLHPPRLLYRSNQEGVTEYKDSRFHMVVPQRGNYSLVLQSAGQEDEGRYFCHVEEWQLQDGGWKMAASDQSGFLHIKVTPPDQTLKLSKQNVSSSVKQGEVLLLHCPLEAEPSPTSLLSISWYQQGWDLLLPRLLYRSNQEGVTEYKDSRLHMVVPQRGNYNLVLQSAGQEDEGRYFCHVEEWQLQNGGWKMAASDQSGFLQIKVTPPENRLSLNCTELTLLVPEQSNVTLPCQVLAVSSPASLLSVSWWKAGGPGAPHTLLFSVNHTGEFSYPRENIDRLQYERPSELTFHLRIHGGHMTDSGTYHCRVQEWLRSPRGVWEPIGERHSGNTSVAVQSAAFRSAICTSPSIFNLLLAFTILFVLLILALIALALWRHRSVGAQRKIGGALWASVKMMEMDKEETGQTQGMDDTPPSLIPNTGELYSQ